MKKKKKPYNSPELCQLYNLGHYNETDWSVGKLLFFSNLFSRGDRSPL